MPVAQYMVPSLDTADKKALRDQFGETLAELGAINPNLVVLDADLSCSTQTQHFAKAFPQRFFNQGIAEMDMVNTAAGLATVGKIPVVSTFALFASGKAWEAVRNTVCYSNLNVKIMPTHSGLSLGEDGASHQSIEDIALMRVIPNMTVIVPADATETEAVVRWAIQEHDGPCYVRLVRPVCPVLFDPATYTFNPSQMAILKEGTDITLVGTGETVYHCLLAAERLQKDHGISAEVLNATFIKPFDGATLVASATKTGKVITVESHQVIGGLGGVVCETLCDPAFGATPVPVKRLGTQDRFGQSGTAEPLFKEYGIHWENIVATAIQWLKP
ncbi:MAG: transketolase family protein [Vampirovibrionales bacterium]|nr:transketolase family protein [Vampirovibrionales bacterium]